MRAIFIHELSSHFSSLTGYVFGAFLLLFVGIYTTVYNLKAASINFEYVLGDMGFVFLVIVPVLTMRVLAEERRQKTDQLLYSLPLSMTRVVIGKYLALLVLFLIPVVIMSAYPLVLSQYGDVYLPAAYSSILGFFFLGAALISMGVFVSSVTENQAVAAGICFVVMLINLFASRLASYLPSASLASFAALAVILLLLAVIVWRMTKNSSAGMIVGGIFGIGLCALYLLDPTRFEGLFPEVVSKLSLFTRFYSIIEGALDLTSIVYYISIIAVCLFLSVQSMEKRRWSE